MAPFVFLGGVGKLVKFPRAGKLLRLACFFYTVKQNRDRNSGLPFLSIPFSLKAKREKGPDQNSSVRPEDLTLMWNVLSGSGPTQDKDRGNPGSPA